MRAADEDILEILQTDKAKAIRLLFDAYYAPMLSYALRLLQDRDQAEDIVQDLFEILWEKDYLHDVEADKLGRYMIRSVKNACNNYINRKINQVEERKLEFLDLPEEIFEPYEDDRFERLLYEIELLPERTRIATEEVMIKGKKYKEAAEEMAVSVNTIKFLLKTALKKLRKRLNEDAD